MENRKPIWIVLILLIIFLSFKPAFAGPGCKNKTGEPGDFRYLTMVSGGIEREYNLYVHPRYENSRPTPLVILLHGAGGNPDWQMWYSNMSAFADAFKFIMVTPKGIGGQWDVSSGSGDVTFVADLIEAVSEDYCIHPERIFATGFSQGGGMSHRLACELSDRIAAIGPVASGTPWIVWPDTCEPERPVSIIQFNGTADLILPFEGGPHGLSGILLPPIPEMFEAYADLYSCSGETEVVHQKGEVTCIEYEDCVDEATLRHCIVEGGGHNWPGAIHLPAWWAGPHTTEDIDASEAIWKFFAEHGMDDED